MKLFEEINVEKKDKLKIKELTDRVDEARCLLDYGAQKLRYSQDQLFAGIDELYPELADYKLSVDHENLTIRIVGLKKELNK